MKHHVTRKKSGEVVKPALRDSSRLLSVTTASSSTKAVRFNHDLEQVRHFFQVDRPISISADSSPVEVDDVNNSDTPFRLYDTSRCPAEREIATTNFSKESNIHMLQLSSLNLSTDRRSLVGTVTVANVSFEKYVAARFSFDCWQTISEVAAEYKHTQSSMGGYDQFQFAIEIPDQADLQTKTLLLCVRYRVNGQEHWDNNSGKDFHVNFTRRTSGKGRSAAGEDPHHRSGRFSDRYNFGASLHAISRSTRHAEQTQNSVLESQGPNGSACLKPWTASIRSTSDVNSAAYQEMIRNFCHFKSWDSAISINESGQHYLAPFISQAKDGLHRDQEPESSKAFHVNFCSSDLHLRRYLSHYPIECSAF